MNSTSKRTTKMGVKKFSHTEVGFRLKETEVSKFESAPEGLEKHPDKQILWMYVDRTYLH